MPSTASADSPKPKRNTTLYGKLAAVLLGLGIIMAVMFVGVIHTYDHTRRQEISQKQYRNLASRLVSERIVSATGQIDQQTAQEVFDRLRIINPRIDVYLLGESGRILASSGKKGILVRDPVNLQPIRDFLGETIDLPILGNDPGDASRQRVFSVAPIAMKGRPNGYLYLVNRGLDLGDSIAQQLKNSYVLRASVLLIGGGLVFALLASTLIIRFITRPLRHLAAVTEKFQRSGFAEHLEQPISRAAASGDEIDRLTDTFVQMSDRILAQMQELQQTDAMRRELIANISHDLRTPLTTLQGYLETLQFKSAQLTAEERSNYLAIALRQSGQLRKLVGDLFELATIALTLSQRKVTVGVADTGSGIAAEDLPRVFDRFYRGEKSRGDSSGNAGLGLAIAKRIVELHKTSIAVTSTPGKGTTVKFEPHCANADEVPAAGDNAQHVDARRTYRQHAA